MKKSKIVDPAVRLQALALFTMINQNYMRAEAYLASLSELLGCDDNFGGAFGEALKKGESFDDVFKREGFVVSSSKTKKTK